MKKIGLKLLLAIPALLILALIVSPSNAKQLAEIREGIPLSIKCPPAQIVLDSFSNEINQARNSFKYITGIPIEYEEVFFAACSFYPELSDVTIVINFAPIPTTMQTQPILGSLFGKRSSREYIISINSNPDFEGILFKDIPINAQIGIIAHELAHILDFEHKNTLELISTGMKFTSKKSQARFEKSIDELTIYKGAGWQLYDWSKYAIFESKATDEYKEFKKEIYLTPSEIEAIIRENPTICNTSI